MTLAEFIEARLGEDEFEAGQVMCEWHDNDRRLREVAAKRAILALHAEVPVGLYCRTCDDGHVPDTWPCETLRLLAAVWSDQPDYQQEWKP